MKPKIKRTIYFTNHRNMLEYLEAFARDHGVTVSSAILGFVGIGLTYEGIEVMLRDQRISIPHKELNRRRGGYEIKKHLQNTPSL